ncbi:PREDICTED: ras GTPase-activating protein nGAP-like [Priapulus caudatus]|uniref:Ras GTPase-activating protein nGAP-like n=1 Tax=Priapulus caudatus TaxID=37621 RepID=A0ABM1DQJ3_PRICU|nr:PREDICTED: ras GTPase-activating protein nGAP-like [Priapulus caudatus]
MSLLSLLTQSKLTILTDTVQLFDKENDFDLQFAKAANPSQDRSKRTDNSLQIWILETKGVQVKKRYFCELCLDKTLYARTSSKQKVDMCFWGENFEFSNLPGMSTVNINLYREADKKKKKEKNSLIGVVSIPVDTINSRTFTEKWYPVTCLGMVKPGKSETVGIRLKLRYQSVNILPLEYYQDLITYISAEYKHLCEMLEPVISVKAKEDLATKMVHIMQKRGKAKEFLCDIVMADVDRLEHENLTFRGNSIATKAMEAYMKLVGEKYLQDTLSEFIKTVLDAQDDCEVDPTKVANNSSLAKHQASLTMYCEMVWCKIINSGCYFPSELKAVFGMIREKLVAREQEDIADNLISSCIFLRFLCPAILAPSLFGLTQEFPQDRAARNLTMTAKTIQNLANFNRFGSKEEFMKFMNDFVEHQWGNMKSFLRQISTTSKDDSNYLEYDGYIDLGKELSILHTVLSESLRKVNKGPCPTQLVKLHEILLNISEDQKNPTGSGSRQRAAPNKKYTDASLSSTSDLTMVSAPCKTSTLGRGATTKPKLRSARRANFDLSSSSDEYSTLESNRDRTEQLRKRLLNGVGNGDYMDIISIMDEMQDEHNTSGEMDAGQSTRCGGSGGGSNNMQGSQMSISQLSNVTSSGYQSFALSQSSSPTDAAARESVASSPPAARPAPLSFANPLYHCPISPVKRLSLVAGGNDRRTSRSSSCSSVSANVSDDDDDDDDADDGTVLHAHPLRKLSREESCSDESASVALPVATRRRDATHANTLPAGAAARSLSDACDNARSPHTWAAASPQLGGGSDSSLLVENRAYWTLESVHANRPRPKPRKSASQEPEPTEHTEKKQLIEQVSLLQEQLQQMQLQLGEAEQRLSEQNKQAQEEVHEWKSRYEEGEMLLSEQQEEKDQQMKNIIARLIGVEEELRKEQQEMQNVVVVKQKIIDAQERRIQSLDSANNRLLAALTQLKDRYHNSENLAPPPPPLSPGMHHVSADNAAFRSSSC